MANEQTKTASGSTDELAPGLSAGTEDQAQAHDDQTSGDNGGQYHANADVGGGASAGVDARAKGSLGDGAGDNACAHVDVYVTAHAGAGGSVGKDGVAAHGGAVAGYGVEADTSAGVHDGRSQVNVSTGATIGPEIGADGSAHATIKDGVLSVGIKGAVAAGLGLKGDVDIDLDTRPIVKSLNDAWDKTFGKL